MIEEVIAGDHGVVTTRRVRSPQNKETPVTTKEFFDKLPATLAEDPAISAGINAAFRFAVRDAGTWTVDLRLGRREVRAGDGVATDCAVECDCADFESVLENPANAMKLYFAGKVKIAGNAMLLGKLGPVLGAVR